jgi:hypothetical protein
LLKEIVMKKSLSSLAAGMIALLVAASPALALTPLASRTFVSGTGSDTGACPLATPCRTFAYALTQTAASGEIIVLSSAGYGTLTINQAVSIINVGYFAGVTVGSGATGITINAGTNDAVTLRGLTIDGGGTGSNGIVFNSGGRLTIDQCDVMNFVGGGPTTGNGILMQPTSGNQNIFVTNTTVSNNGNVGVYYLPPSGTAAAGIVIDRVRASGNQYGIAINNFSSSGAATASISNSISSLNFISGFFFENVTASLDASNASSNSNGSLGAGVILQSTGTLALGRSVLMNNFKYGLNNLGGIVNSYGDNRIAGNGTAPVNGTISTATLF